LEFQNLPLFFEEHVSGILFRVIPFSSMIRLRGCGYLKDPPDTRDRDFRMLGVGESPPSASVRSRPVQPKDQKGTQSCAGQAVAQGIRTAYLQLGLECPDLSGLSLYHWSRALWGGQKSDGGTYLRTTIQAAQKLGCPAETKWPFSVPNVNKAPPPTALFDGARRRGLRSYYRVPAIAAGYPVVGGWQIDRDFLNNSGPARIDYIRPSAFIGGHAMLIEEYDSSGFGLLNSYGLDWREDGRAECTDAFVAQAIDLWAIDVSPEFT
jgi:hypothetical protein